MKKILVVLSALMLLLPSVSSCNNNKPSPSITDEVKTFDSEAWKKASGKERANMLDLLLETDFTEMDVNKLKELLGEPDDMHMVFNDTYPQTPSGEYDLIYYLDDKEYVNENKFLRFRVNKDKKYVSHDILDGHIIKANSNFTLSQVILFDEELDSKGMEAKVKELIESLHYGYVNDNDKIDLDNMKGSVAILGMEGNAQEAFVLDLDNKVIIKFTDNPGVQLYSNLNEAQMKIVNDLFKEKIDKIINARYTLVSLFPELNKLKNSKIVKVKVNDFNGSLAPGTLLDVSYTDNPIDIKNILDNLDMELYQDPYYQITPGQGGVRFTYYKEDESYTKISILDGNVISIGNKYYRLVKGSFNKIVNPTMTGQFILSHEDTFKAYYINGEELMVPINGIENYIFKESDVDYDGKTSLGSIKGDFGTIIVIDVNHFFYHNKTYEIVGDINFSNIFEYELEI